MGMPSVIISFSQKAATALSRGERGIISMIEGDRLTVSFTVITIYGEAEVDDIHV